MQIPILETNCGSDPQFEQFLNDLRKSHYTVQQEARKHQSALSGKDQDCLGPKFPVESFNYESELGQLTDEVMSEEELAKEMYSFFQGVARPQSELSLFNMVPEPMTTAIVGSCMATLYNVNSLMDAYGGKSLLIEQKVVRTIGKWVDWNESYGIACNGGKLTMLYAVKAAISKIAPDSQSKGIPDNLVVIANEGGHYCVEHVCSLLGIGTERCLRGITDEYGKMDLKNLEEIMEIEIKKGNKIAAIICSGGTTINFFCDNTQKVADFVDDFVVKHKLDYRPHLHLDSVIGWIYFTLVKKSNEEISNFKATDFVKNKLMETKNRFLGLATFDSFGVDFHKDGLCPYSSSFFVSKTADCFNLLNDGNYKYDAKDFDFEQFRAYRYTLENSKPSQGILSAWMVLKKIGSRGLIQYLTQLHETQYKIIKEIEKQGVFKVLNKCSLGWEVVFAIQFKKLAAASEDFNHDQAAMSFMQRCWDKVNRGEVFPLFSVVPDYRIDNDRNNTTTAFLIYPMQGNLSLSSITAILHSISNEVSLFEETVLKNKEELVTRIFEKPIR